MTAQVFNPSDPEGLRRGLRQARLALAAGQVVLIPTDTHYALVADGLSAAGLDALSLAKGWDSTPIVQVLLPGVEALPALAANVDPVVSALAEAFWPGPLSVIVDASSTLRWNLGEHIQAVGLRMTKDVVAGALLEDVGPLIISGAQTADLTAGSAEEFVDQAGARVAVALIDPQRPWEFSSPVSTVIDTRGLADAPPSVGLVRAGEISKEAIAAVIGSDVAWSATSR